VIFVWVVLYTSIGVAVQLILSVRPSDRRAQQSLQWLDLSPPGLAKSWPQLASIDGQWQRPCSIVRRGGAAEMLTRSALTNAPAAAALVLSLSLFFRRPSFLFYINTGTNGGRHNHVICSR